MRPAKALPLWRWRPLGWEEDEDEEEEEGVGPARAATAHAPSWGPSSFRRADRGDVFRSGYWCRRWAPWDSSVLSGLARVRAASGGWELVRGPGSRGWTRGRLLDRPRSR